MTEFPEPGKYHPFRSIGATFQELVTSLLGDVQRPARLADRGSETVDLEEFDPLTTRQVRRLDAETVASRLRVEQAPNRECSAYRVTRIEPDDDAMLLVDTYRGEIRWAHLPEGSDDDADALDECNQGALVLAALDDGSTETDPTLDPPEFADRWEVVALERISETTLTFYEDVEWMPDIADAAAEKAGEEEWGLASTFLKPGSDYALEVHASGPDDDPADLYRDYRTGRQVLEDYYDRLETASVPAQDIIVVLPADDAYMAIICFGPDSPVVDEYHERFSNASEAETVALAADERAKLIGKLRDKYCDGRHTLPFDDDGSIATEPDGSIPLDASTPLTADDVLSVHEHLHSEGSREEAGVLWGLIQEAVLPVDPIPKPPDADGAPTVGDHDQPPGLAVTDAAESLVVELTMASQQFVRRNFDELGITSREGDDGELYVTLVGGDDAQVSQVARAILDDSDADEYELQGPSPVFTFLTDGTGGPPSGSGAGSAGAFLKVEVPVSELVLGGDQFRVAVDPPEDSGPEYVLNDAEVRVASDGDSQ